MTSRPIRDLILAWTSLDQYPDEDAAAAGSARFGVVDYTAWRRWVYPGTIGRSSSSSSSGSSDGDSSDGGSTTSGDSGDSDSDGSAAAAADGDAIAAFVKVRAVLLCWVDDIAAT